MPHILPVIHWDDQSRPERRPREAVFAMSGEDGVIAKIFAHIPPLAYTAVEIGVSLDPEPRQGGERVLQCNTEMLRRQGWRTWMFDGNPLPELGVIGELVTPLNINALWRRYDLPPEPDLFSLDVDGQDWWIWLALMARPRVVIVEYNAHHDTDVAVTTAWDRAAAWQGDTYYGASLKAFDLLAADKGYHLVFVNGANAFFVRADLLANPENFPYERLAYRVDFHQPHPPDRTWVRI
jgi:hypothetical protein